MPWQYSQSSGSLQNNGNYIATGYSGSGAGRNNGAMEHLRDIGPIPRGAYQIGRARRSNRTGPHVMDLTPRGHNAHGRHGFQIHGDNTAHNASTGCIILRRDIRERISTSGDDVLNVVNYR